jgi:hypothetical protein
MMLLQLLQPRPADSNAAADPDEDEREEVENAAGELCTAEARSGMCIEEAAF